MWIAAAILSAVFAAITSILAKCGIKKTDSDIATALRTGVILIFSWIMVFVAGSFESIADISMKSLVFLVLSGLVTGLSWICYFKALSIGDINKVVPIDKSSTVLTVLAAIVLFGERNHLIIKLISTVLIGIGAFLMVEKKAVEKTDEKKSWLVYALLSAVFAAATSILAKIGISDVESNLATAIRTIVVLAVAFGIVFAKGKANQILQTDRRELIFIVFSGIATGASWLFYYYAIQKGDVSVVVPIDKMSILVSVLFAYIVFKEKLSKKALLGLIMMTAGTLAMVIMK